MTNFGRLRSAAMATLLGAFMAGPANAEGNAANGEELAYTCLGCHGIEGYRNAYPSFRVPRLGGQRTEYIVNALTAYKNGTRAHPTMQAQGGSLSEQDIEDIAVYFQGAAAATDTVTMAEVGNIDALKTCVACHGAGGEVVVPKPPVLSGQQMDYLEHALSRYKNGERTANVMTAFAATLSEEDMKVIARFYGSRDGVYTPESD